MREHQIFSLLLSFATTLILLPTSVRAQCHFGDCFDAYLVATYDGSAMQLRLSLGHRTFGPLVCRGNAVGFDVYRKTIGYLCGPEERVTDQPIAWVAECDAEIDLSFTDPNVKLDTGYQYEARPVDAERNPAQGDGVSSILGYGVAGTAVVAHGEVWPSDNFTTYAGSCPEECFPGGLVDAPSIYEYWGTTVTIIATEASVRYHSNLWVTLFHGSSVNRSRCLVAVEDVDWSAVKRIYD